MPPSSREGLYPTTGSPARGNQFQRPSREPPRAISDSNALFGHAGSSIARPNTGGSISSASAGRLPSRGNSYSQPLAPTVAATNAQGRLAQPKGPRAYNISAPIPQPEPYIADDTSTRPSSQRVPSRYGTPSQPPPAGEKGHKRSSTLTNVFNRSASFFGAGGGGKPPSQPAPENGKSEKRYPPTSMKAPIAADPAGGPVPASPRASTDSRRPSFGFARRGSDLSRESKPRRFSLLPASFSLRNFTGGGGGSSSKGQDSSDHSRAAPPSAHSHAPSASYAPRESMDIGPAGGGRRATNPAPPSQLSRSYDPPRGYASPSGRAGPGYAVGGGDAAAPSYDADAGGYRPSSSRRPAPGHPHEQTPVYPPGARDFEDAPPPPPRTAGSYASPPPTGDGGRGRGPRVLHKPNRRFADAWESGGAQGEGQHAGTSGAAKRVMDFFRRRGKARNGDDR